MAVLDLRIAHDLQLALIAIASYHVYKNTDVVAVTSTHEEAEAFIKNECENITNCHSSYYTILSNSNPTEILDTNAVCHYVSQILSAFVELNKKESS